VGLCLAGPHLLPAVAYARTGARVARRAAGAEERPPIGAAALPQMVLPDMYGSTRPGSVYLLDPNLLESAAAAYAGLFATLVVAPLAWCDRRRRSQNLFWVLQGFLGLAWVLDVPGLVSLMRLPGFNMFSYNRLVFATSFAVLALAVSGLDAAWGGVPARRWWWALPVGALVGLGAWCLYRSFVPPDELTARLVQQASVQQQPDPARPLQEHVRRVLEGFANTYLGGAALCGLGVAAWLVVAASTRPRAWLGPALSVLLVGDLFWFAHGRSTQSDPSLYYPPLPVLEKLAQAPAGRFLGIRCLAPRMNEFLRLRDVRGYDAVDPLRLVELLRAVQDKRFRSFDYATVQYYVPEGVAAVAEGVPAVTLPGIVNMLAVRYLVFLGSPPPSARPVLSGDGYWVVENPAALPRVSVPRRVEVVADQGQMLARLAAKDFDPRQVAYVAEPVDLPGDCRGSAEIAEEVPTRLSVSVDMQTPGLLLLSDLWYEGWQATFDGRPVPILRVNHALRGVVVPAGRGTVMFRYWPPGLTGGLEMAAAGMGGLMLWAGVLAWAGRRARRAGAAAPAFEGSRRPQ
jgi:hypothetical protein